MRIYSQVPPEPATIQSVKVDDVNDLLMQTNIDIADSMNEETQKSLQQHFAFASSRAAHAPKFSSNNAQPQRFVEDI